MSQITLKDLAGTGRGLGSLTIDEIQDLLGQHAKTTGATKSARREGKGKKGKAAKVERTEVTKGKKKPAPKSEFYEKVIVGQREERAKRQKVNREASAWMREHGLVPSGQAWAAVKNGERGIKKLQALNAADGLTPVAAKGGEAKAKQAEVKPAVRKTGKGGAAKPAPKQEEFDVEKQIETLMAGGFSREEATQILA